MKSFRRLNNVTGWVIFVVASIVYILTSEPTGSFWDCGEFISCAYKLQIAHSPGAPLFLILGRLFTLFASGPDKVALMVNLMSNLMGGLTSLFLFWSITMLARKIIGKKESELGIADIILILASGFVGALASTFTDSIWFSAVEGEVYASSSAFTAFVFWAILKWENQADEPQADRWLLLIAYVMGLSIGVHLLNLLCIPAIVFVYYFKKHHDQITGWGAVKILILSCIILAGVQYGIIPSIPNYALKFDILFRNSFELPYNTGAITFSLLVIALITFGFIYAKRKNNYMLHMSVLLICMIILGYTSYAMVLIRANANPSLNMSNPKDLINLVSYLNREQYGERPLLYGQVFTARPTDIDWNGGEMKYWKGPVKYEELGRKPIVEYSSEDKMLFPRVWDNDDGSHVKFYQSWLNLNDKQKPTMADNINFFITYQMNWMYWRYFMWNFAGRQNDIQGQTGGIKDGNWISGINLIDNMRLGSQDNLPPSMTDNQARNKFYLLPLILGLLGVFFHYKKRNHDAWVVMLLFFFTGLAIVIYLNQTPLQPRERDYAYAGSIYAFCIWIGLGVLSVANWLSKKLSPINAALAATVLSLLAPVIMGAQGWDDHNRSNRYTARDFGRNYLESCAPNAILFTQGDNDTYPLWYAQEVEGIRPDVRIVNLSLLGVDWYIDNLKRKINDADAVPISLPDSAYRGSKRDVTRYSKNPGLDPAQYYNIKDVVDFMSSENPAKKVKMYGNELDNYLPVKNLFLPVNKNQIIKDKVVPESDMDSIVNRVEWTLNRSTILKPSLLLLDIIKTNDWKRPIYFAISVSSDEYLGLNDYLQQEGLTYRLVPVKHKSLDGLPGRVNTDIMYKNLMNFWWGGVDKNKVYLDENILRMVSNLRSNFARLANSLIAEGNKEKAIEVLNKCQEVLPERNVPYSLLMLPIAQSYYKAGAADKGKEIVKKLVNWYGENMKYFTSLDDAQRAYYRRDMNEAVYVFSECSQIADNSKDTELQNLVKPLFEKYRPYYSFDQREQEQDDN